MTRKQEDYLFTQWRTARKHRAFAERSIPSRRNAKAMRNATG